MSQLAAAYCSALFCTCLSSSSPTRRPTRACPQRRWLIPRLPSVEELNWQLRCSNPLSPRCLPGLILPQAPDSAPLPLARLSVCWSGFAIFELLYPSQLASLTRLHFLQGTTLGAGAVSREGVHGMHSLPALKEFALTDGSLAGSPEALGKPWLPPTLTSLILGNAGVRELPGVLRHLPKLRR